MTSPPTLNTSHTSDASVLGSILKPAAIGFAISVVGIMIPIAHFVTGPLGPFIGGWYTASNYKPSTKGALAIAVLMGLFWAVFGLIIFNILASFIPSIRSSAEGLLGNPTVTVPIIAFVYVTCLAAVGALIGALYARRDEDE